jgi:hypothetical protein
MLTAIEKARAFGIFAGNAFLDVPLLTFGTSML